MKTTRRIVSVLALIAVLAVSVVSCAAPADGGWVASAKNAVTQKKMAASTKKNDKATPAKKEDKTKPAKKNDKNAVQPAQEQKELLARLVESGSLTQQKADEIKGYLNKKAVATDKAAKMKKKDYLDNNAALNKLNELITDKKLQKKACTSIGDSLWKAYEKAHKDKNYVEPVESKLTQTMLKEMVQAKALTQDEMDQIVIQQCRDALSVCLESKGISQADYDTVKELIDKAAAKPVG